MKPRVLFYCQHVLGMGHMVRSREIVRGLVDFDVVFINGGEPAEEFHFPPRVQVVQLPPIRSDEEFTDIDATEELKTWRRRMLLDLLVDVDPHVFLMEMFPFGRRKFAYELVPCLEQIERQGRRTAVVSSVRDILVSKRDQARHEDSACTLLNRHFDLVLVHSDPRFQRLEETFLRTRDIACPIAYTGFVKEETVSPVLPPRSGVPRVIASIGGGRVGDHLLLSVIRASRLLQTDLRHELHVFAGPYMDADDFRELQRAAADAAHIRITRFASDFVNQMAAADLSLSMAGYNTCMNILTTGTRAMVFPFSGNGNEEQTVRATKLAALGLLDVLDDQMLGPLPLACRMKKALTSPGKAGPVKLDLNGVSNTVRFLQSALKRTAWCV